ncbi:MAG: DMT family transporter [Acidobacteriaceae bacterium]
MSSLGKHRALGFLAAFLASCFWGCGFFFGKIALREMNVGAMIFYRFTFATVGLIPLLLSRRPHFNAAEWSLLLLTALLGVPLQFLIQFKGLSLTTVSHAALMVGAMPVILAVGATLFAKERLSSVGWVALGASTLGAALVVLGGSHHASSAGAANMRGVGPTLGGDLLVLASLFIGLFWILLNKHLMEKHNHVVVTAHGIAIGTLMLALYVPFAYGTPPLHGVSFNVWAALAASGLLCTAATTLLWNWGITQVPASQAGVLLNMEPLIGSLLGVFVLHEHLGPRAWLGGSLILVAAVTLTTRVNTPLEDPAMV